MKSATSWALAILWSFACTQGLYAQNLQITNAHVIVGNGDVIERGGIVVRRGRIASISDGALVDSELPQLDADGLTVMPGFIDAHRRVIQGEPAQWMQGADERMREYIEAGFTTVLSTGDPLEPILELRDRLDAREIKGPRILVSAPVRLTTDSGNAVSGEEIRATVRNLTLGGADAIAAIVRAIPASVETEALTIARDEADRQGLLTITHIESIEDTRAAVAGGSGYLTRTPSVGVLDEGMARDIVESGRRNAEYGLVMTSALGRSVPTFSDRNEYARAAAGGDASRPDSGSAPYPRPIRAIPLASDLEPYPLADLYTAARGAANARRLRDAGIIYGFGTDTPFPPVEALRHELIPLTLVFSNREIVDILTRSAAFAARRDDALGTLEPGKIADMVIVDGDPIADIYELFDIRVVIRTGQVVVDHR